MAVFRIVQEALTNIHRHARTSEAFIRIRLELASLLVEIEDRGQGITDFTSLDRQRMGVGLRGMRERVRRLSGQFQVRSGKNGTTVTANLSAGGCIKVDCNNSAPCTPKPTSCTPKPPYPGSPYMA